MHYDPRLNDHGLPYDPILAIVAPRPIGWISTLSPDGKANLAPYSFFNLFSKSPPIVGYSCNGEKDTLANIRTSGEFVCNLATLDHIDAVNRTSASLPHGHSEFEAYGIGTTPSQRVKAPRVADVPCALECRLISEQRLTTADGAELNQTLVLGEIVGVYIRDDAILGGRLRLDMIKPLTRCGYRDYASIDSLRDLPRPA